MSKWMKIECLTTPMSQWCLLECAVNTLQQNNRKSKENAEKALEYKKESSVKKK